MQRMPGDCTGSVLVIFLVHLVKISLRQYSIMFSFYFLLASCVNEKELLKHGADVIGSAENEPRIKFVTKCIYLHKLQSLTELSDRYEPVVSQHPSVSMSLTLSVLILGVITAGCKSLPRQGLKSDSLGDSKALS